MKISDTLAEMDLMSPRVILMSKIPYAELLKIYWAFEEWRMDDAENISKSNQRSLGNDLWANLFNGDHRILPIIQSELETWITLRRASYKIRDIEDMIRNRVQDIENK